MITLATVRAVRAEAAELKAASSKLLARAFQAERSGQEPLAKKLRGAGFAVRRRAAELTFEADSYALGLALR